jgi:hypothetical protein
MSKTHSSRTPTASRSLDAAGCACENARRHVEPDRAAIPIACDLTVFTPTERAEHRTRSQSVLGAIERLTEEAEGFVLAFAASPSRRGEVEHWIEAERRCCPFFHFEVWDENSGDTFAVRVSGPGAAKEILRAGIERYGLVSEGT